jgi:predicted nucleotidyltransferase
MQPGRFTPDSDIDVAVECQSVETESAFWRVLEQALRRDVDVRPYIGAIVDAVKWYGEKVYERESDHPHQ